MVSTTRDVSAFFRAFHQDGLLPPELRQVLTERPGGPAQNGGGGGLCGGALKGALVFGGTAGFTAMTFASFDGRTQYAVSTTHSVADTAAIGPAMVKSAESVLCAT
ncbi:hypothetical protein [Spongiactinospora sp. 9N601]|uniref:hypothetical protein n=1 Tax=Spongiactinospora sp. 9N601 TaxID=3375149 RepID=UPI0037912ABC